jgi:hypothetical protein
VARFNEELSARGCVTPALADPGHLARAVKRHASVPCPTLPQQKKYGPKGRMDAHNGAMTRGARPRGHHGELPFRAVLGQRIKDLRLVRSLEPEGRGRVAHRL